MDNKQYYMQVMYDDDDDSDSFCRVPEDSSPGLIYRLPYSSTSSLTLTESGEYATSAPNRCNNSSDEQYDEHEQQQEDISDKHSTSKSKEENCCGGSVLHGILTFISPKKKKRSNALSLSYEELINGHPSASSFKTSESCQQLGGCDSGDTWASPSGVNNFPYHQTPLPTFPKELFPEPPLNRQEQQQHEEEDSGSTNLQYIIAASRYEEESRFDEYTVSSLEEYLQQQQSQNLSDTCFVQAHNRATALHKLGVLHWKLGRHFFSEHVLLDCMYTYQNILDTANPSDQQLVFESAQVLASLGRLHSSKGDEESAKDFHNKALETFKQVLQSEEESDELCVNVLNSIASSYAATSRLDKALKYHEKEVSLRSKLTPYHICVARLYLHMSKIAMQAVDCNGEYLDKVDTWLVKADEVYCHQEGLVSDSELMSLESIMEEHRRRRMEME